LRLLVTAYDCQDTQAHAALHYQWAHCYLGAIARALDGVATETIVTAANRCRMKPTAQKRPSSLQKLAHPRRGHVLFVGYVKSEYIAMSYYRSRMPHCSIDSIAAPARLVTETSDPARKETTTVVGPKYCVASAMAFAARTSVVASSIMQDVLQK